MKDKCDFKAKACILDTSISAVAQNNSVNRRGLKYFLSASSGCVLLLLNWVQHGCKDMLVGWQRADDDGYVNMYMSTSFNVHAAFVQDF